MTHASLPHDWVSGGTPHHIETEHRDGESNQAWQARHAAAVAFWEGVYPPDP